MIGVKVTFHSNVLYCNYHRSRWDNLMACVSALAMLTGEPHSAIYNELMLTEGAVQFYKSS